VSFGNRGSATDKEHEASEYLRGELHGLGLDVDLEQFSGCSSYGARWLLHVAIAAFGLGFLGWAPALSAGLGAVALISFVADEMTFGCWLSRPLLRMESFNVVGRFPTIAKPALRVVVCAHYDTQRTGWMMSVAERLTALQWRLPTALKPPLLLLGLCFGLQALGGIGAIWVDGSLVFVLGWLLAAAYTVFGLLFTQWAVSPFVPGAADNASGAAAALTLADAWTREPIPGVDLVVVLTGCEESGLLAQLPHLAT
jgi:acetylornithine deacetylase/succinyl-diaminopimelate desuccinylase-like protein